MSHDLEKTDRQAAPTKASCLYNYIKKHHIAHSGLDLMNLHQSIRSFSMRSSSSLNRESGMGERGAGEAWLGLAMGDRLRSCSGCVARGVCVRTGAAGEEGFEAVRREDRPPPTRGGSCDLPRAEPREPDGEGNMPAELLKEPLKLPTPSTANASGPAESAFSPLSSASTCRFACCTQ
eukprot:scaffold31082_cov14-Tisochrysis_lutea.AAC.1